MKKLTVEASIHNLDEVLDFVNGELELHNCPQNLRNEINIAVEEIFMNIARYAYEPEIGTAAILISVGEEIAIRFEDTGKHFNPLEQAAPDLDKPLMERQIGGLGVFMVRKLMDDVAYSYVDNKNILIIKKKMCNSHLSQTEPL